MKAVHADAQNFTNTHASSVYFTVLLHVWLQFLYKDVFVLQPAKMHIHAVCVTPGTDRASAT